MRIFDYICLLIILIGVGIIYKRYINKYDKDIETHQYEVIRKYLLNSSSITSQNKPIIWIHVPYEYNARKWQSFYSRTSMDLNLPYQELTIRSIIDHNENFHICLIDDSSFVNLLPGWTIDITKMGDPIKSKARKLCLFKLIYNYGGIVVPSSFLCLQNLSVFYDVATMNNKPFVIENHNTSYTGNNNLHFMPDCSFIGSPKNNETIKHLCEFAQNSISTDYTQESIFLGEFNKWCLLSINNNKMNLINGSQVGTKTENGKPILIEELINADYLNLPNDKKLIGVYIPADKLLARNSLNWFCYLKSSEILKANTAISKYFIIAKVN